MELPQLPDQLKALDRTRRREMTPLEVMAEHYLKGGRLTERQEEYRALLETANSLLCEGKPRRDVAQMLITLHQVQKTSAYKVINDAIELFGDVQKNTRQGLVYLQTQWYERIALKAEEAGNLELAIMARARIDKINGLESQKVGTVNIKNLLMPKNLIFTTDPAALDEMRRQEAAEEAEYEEVEE